MLDFQGRISVEIRESISSIAQWAEAAGSIASPAPAPAPAQSGEAATSPATATAQPAEAATSPATAAAQATIEVAVVAHGVKSVEFGLLYSRRDPECECQRV